MRNSQFTAIMRQVAGYCRSPRKYRVEWQGRPVKKITTKLPGYLAVIHMRTGTIVGLTEDVVKSIRSVKSLQKTLTVHAAVALGAAK